jgi:hypothetical protein
MEVASAVVGGTSSKSEKKMKCAKGDVCKVAVFAKCDFCGEVSQSGVHRHLKLPTEQIKYFKLNEATEDFVVCSSLCGARICTFLNRCDLTQGLPHMIRKAYPASHLRGSKGEYECFTCRKEGLVGDMVRADLHWGSFVREQELFFCKSSRCLLRYCETQRTEDSWWMMEWRLETVLRGSGAKKCSDKCEVPERFRCDFCGQISNVHRHIKNIGSKMIELSEPVEEFYVCSPVCGERMTRALIMCDLAFGMPYRIKSAYNPYIFRTKMDSLSCTECKEFRPREHMEPGHPISETGVLWFCTARYCLRNYTEGMQSFYESEGRAAGRVCSRWDWKVRWHVRPLNEAGGDISLCWG